MYVTLWNHNKSHYSEDTFKAPWIGRDVETTFFILKHPELVEKWKQHYLFCDILLVPWTHIVLQNFIILILD